MFIMFQKIGKHLKKYIKIEKLLSMCLGEHKNIFFKILPTPNF